jgi:molecular chaperone GrpE
MSYMYDPRNRRRPGSPQAAPGAVPTIEDFNELVRLYREQQVRIEALTRELQARQSELTIRDEALKRAGDETRKLQSDLIWTQAALGEARQQIEAAAAADGEGWQERYTRLQAEVDTLRRRWEQRAVDDTAEARRAMLRDMLPLADHLEMALSHRDALDGEAGRAFAASIETTLKAFLDSLRRYGVEVQDPLGKPFDPAQHEAVGQVVVDETPPGHVAYVVQNGYTEGDRLLRPARVLVSQEKPAA